jgi:hypothetical protein
LNFRFTGLVECRRSPGFPGVTLVGRTNTGDQTHLSLVGEAPAELPARLESPQVERVDAEHCRISSGPLTLTLQVVHSYLHQDVSGAFYQAVRPRPVPFAKRVFWRLVLAGARTRIATWWLARSRA